MKIIVFTIFVSIYKYTRTALLITLDVNVVIGRTKVRECFIEYKKKFQGIHKSIKENKEYIESETITKINFSS